MTAGCDDEGYHHDNDLMTIYDDGYHSPAKRHLFYWVSVFKLYYPA